MGCVSEFFVETVVFTADYYLKKCNLLKILDNLCEIRFLGSARANFFGLRTHGHAIKQMMLSDQEHPGELSCEDGPITLFSKPFSS